MNTGYLKILVAMCIVGSSVVVGKLIVQDIPIFIACVLRFLIASIILVPLLILKEGIPSLTKKEFLVLFGQAISGVFLFNIFMLYGLKYTSAIEAGVITSTIPAVIGILSLFLLNEKLTKKKSVGIFCAMLGVLSMNVLSSSSEQMSSLGGNLLILGAVLGEALFIIFGKLSSNRVSPLTISTMVSIFGFILFLPFAIYEAKEFNFLDISLGNWGNILYFGIVVTVIAFLLMYDGLKTVSASSTGVLTSVLPVSSLILSFLILKEKLMYIHFVGMLLVIVAIFLISMEPSNQEGRNI
ncbi:DMT family transporter [Lysinibacillus sp. KU-BSD001]|uniref:DMT family transporter n=1 Tax=Lysinibacillus sp. KU-BSD001 TaxID=3141328 RepID=UPI0036EF64A4